METVHIFGHAIDEFKRLMEEDELFSQQTQSRKEEANFVPLIWLMSKWTEHISPYLNNWSDSIVWYNRWSRSSGTNGLLFNRQMPIDLRLIEKWSDHLWIAHSSSFLFSEHLDLVTGCRGEVTTSLPSICRQFFSFSVEKSKYQHGLSPTDSALIEQFEWKPFRR